MTKKAAPGILIVSGDRIQGHGRIFMFGGHLDMRVHIASLDRLETKTAEFHEIRPSHADHAARMKDEFDMYCGGECPMKIKDASWISLKQAASTVVPVFRKQFLCGKPVRSAALEVTCDGVYEAALNGRRVGDFILAPGWTEYRKRLQVQTYDVKDLLTESNTLEITVANGWYRRTNAPWTGTQNPDEFLPAMLIAALHLVFEDGVEMTILTDA